MVTLLDVSEPSAHTIQPTGAWMARTCSREDGGELSWRTASHRRDAEREQGNCSGGTPRYPLRKKQRAGEEVKEQHTPKPSSAVTPTFLLLSAGLHEKPRL